MRYGPRHGPWVCIKQMLNKRAKPRLPPCFGHSRFLREKREFHHTRKKEKQEQGYQREGKKIEGKHSVQVVFGGYWSYWGKLLIPWAYLSFHFAHMHAKTSNAWTTSGFEALYMMHETKWNIDYKHVVSNFEFLPVAIFARHFLGSLVCFQVTTSFEKL